MSNPPLRRDRCSYCQRDIVWGTLQSGHARSFDAVLKPLREVPPGDAYAYSKRYRAMVCLDGELYPPHQVLQAHRCREYAEAKLMANVDDMPDLYEAMARDWSSRG